MGYTHKFEHTEVTQEVWDAIVSDCQTLMSNLPSHSLSSGAYHKQEPLQIGDGSGNGGLPILDRDAIWLNGVGEMAHETFLLERQDSDRLTWCKTERKPYDLMVQACLIVYYTHSPDTIELRSDGTKKDWAAAYDFVTEVLGSKLEIPPHKCFGPAIDEVGLTHQDFTRATQEFTKKVDKYLGLLVQCEESHKAQAHSSNSGAVKADYENLIRRLKEKPPQLMELLSLLDQTKDMFTNDTEEETANDDSDVPS